jgi:tetratricopeptide (TPR) repeat protein
MVSLSHKSGIVISTLVASLLTGCATNLQRGQEAGMTGDYRAMLENCQMAAKEKNPNPLAFKCIGDAQLKLGDRDAAEAAYLTYLDQKPDDTDLRSQLVEIYITDGRYQAAQKHAELILQFDPASYQANYYMGEIHRVNGLCDLSKQSYERALEINPNYYVAQTGLNKLQEVCPPEPEPEAPKPVKTQTPPKPKVKTEKVFKGGGKALDESQW